MQERSKRRRSLASFLPTDLADLAIWLIAEPETITIATGVSQWADQSGNGHNFVQATGANQPAYDGTKLTFTGTSSHFLTCSTLQVNDFNDQDFECFFVCEGAAFRAGAENATTPRLYFVGSSYSYDAFNNVPFTHTAPLQALSFGHDGTNAYVRRNNAAVASAAVAQFTTGAAVNVSLGKAAGSFADTILREVVLYLRNLSAGERSRLQSYFAARHSL